MDLPAPPEVGLATIEKLAQTKTLLNYIHPGAIDLFFGGMVFPANQLSAF